MQTITKAALQAHDKGYRYLETDGNGGFISQTALGGNVRNDDSLLTISLRAPIKRYKLVQKFNEVVVIDGVSYCLSSQTYVNDKRNTCSKNLVVSFNNEFFPQVIFQVSDVTIIKKLIFSNATSQVALEYKVLNPFSRLVELKITPQISGHELGVFKPECAYDYVIKSVNSQIVGFESVSAENIYIKSDITFIETSQVYTGDYYYPHDSRDGRDACGSSASYGYFHKVESQTKFSCSFILSSRTSFEYDSNELFNREVDRKKKIVATSIGKSAFTKSLALATDNYLVNRESTSQKSIIAGYPFFGDWGRDTFWAFNGTCLQTRRFKAAKEILRSFIKYEKDGLLPNMFPEGDEDPMYNSVDAPLLFINSVYEYYQYTGDQQFIIEVKSTIESIVNNFIRGTEFNIKMDDDGLISSGSGLLQLTWMDVRFDTILPTPRHGKCVEINAMWYNALRIITVLESELQTKFAVARDLKKLASKVKINFCDKFILENGYLKDIIAGTSADNQIRSNALWAVTQHYSPLSTVQMKEVVAVASKCLYTPLGIRTLAPSDPEFKPKYGDSHFERDMAYHQGTVWPFILGGYIRAYLKANEYSSEAKEYAKLMLTAVEGALSEYCVGQICEVLDGLNPSISKGCYAQAWSIAEIYRAANEVEE